MAVSSLFLHDTPDVVDATGRGGQAEAAPLSAKVGGEPILPAHVKTCGDRPTPEGQDPQD